MAANIDWEKILGPLFGIGTGAAGGLLAKLATDKLSDVGQAAKDQATALAGQIGGMTQFRPFTVTSAQHQSAIVDPERTPAPQPAPGVPNVPAQAEKSTLPVAVCV